MRKSKLDALIERAVDTTLMTRVKGYVDGVLAEHVRKEKNMPGRPYIPGPFEELPNADRIRTLVHRETTAILDAEFPNRAFKVEWAAPDEFRRGVMREPAWVEVHDGLTTVRAGIALDLRLASEIAKHVPWATALVTSVDRAARIYFVDGGWYEVAEGHTISVRNGVR